MVQIILSLLIKTLSARLEQHSFIQTQNPFHDVITDFDYILYGNSLLGLGRVTAKTLQFRVSIQSVACKKSIFVVVCGLRY